MRVPSGLAILALLLFPLGCGNDDASTDPTDATTAEAQECTSPSGQKSGSAQIAAGYATEVRGVSCQKAGVLIRDDFIGAFQKVLIREGAAATKQPSSFESAGWECRSKPLTIEGGWHLECRSADQTMGFDFTP